MSFLDKKGKSKMIDKSRFLTSNPGIALLYRTWLNKLIYKSEKENKNPFWQRAWEDYLSSPELTNFESFLNTLTGKKWLDSEFGKMYRIWGEG